MDWLATFFIIYFIVVLILVIIAIVLQLCFKDFKLSIINQMGIVTPSHHQVTRRVSRRDHLLQEPQGNVTSVAYSIQPTSQALHKADCRESVVGTIPLLSYDYNRKIKTTNNRPKLFQKDIGSQSPCLSLPHSSYATAPNPYKADDNHFYSTSSVKFNNANAPSATAPFDCLAQDGYESASVSHNSMYFYTSKPPSYEEAMNCQTKLTK